MDLAWTNQSSNQTGFNIYAAAGTSQAYEYFDSVVAASTTYAATGLSSNTAYSFKVGAFSDRGESSRSVAPTVTTPIITFGGGAGTAPTTSPGTSSREVGITWDPVPDATAYGIEWKGDGPNAAFAALATIDATQTTFPATGLTPGTTYTFRIKAYTPAGTGTSQTVTRTTAPRTPSDLSVTISGGHAKLQWSSVKGATQYTVERKTGQNGGWTPVSLAAGTDGVSQVDSTALSDQILFYHIKSVGAGGTSEFSDDVSLLPIPAAPIIQDVTLNYNTAQFTITWTAGFGNQSGFHIFKSDDGINYTPAGEASATETQHSIGFTHGDEGKTYTFKVIAYNAVGDSATSNTIDRYIAPPKSTVAALSVWSVFGDPSGFVVTARYDHSAVSNLTNVQVERSIDGSPFSDVHDFMAGGTSEFVLAFGNVYQATFQDAPPANGSNYYYRLKGVTAWGDTYYSAVGYLDGNFYEDGGPGDTNLPTDSPPVSMPTVSLVATTATAYSNPPSPAVVTIQRTGDSTYALHVAMKKTKYGSNNLRFFNVTIPAGSNSATVAFYPDPAAPLTSQTFQLASAFYSDLGSTFYEANYVTRSVTVDFVANPSPDPVTLLAANPERTDGRFGDSGPGGGVADPRQYLVPTNNNYDVDLTGQTRDYDEPTVRTTTTNASQPDRDLAKVVLVAPANIANIHNGTLSVQLSSANARLFTDAGVPLINLSVNLASPSGELQLLATGQSVPVWVEGLHEDPDLVFKYAYTNNVTGYETARATIHLAIVDFSFVDGTGATVESVPSVSTKSNTDQAAGAPGATLGGGFGAFLPKLTGLPDITGAQVTASDGTQSGTPVVGPFTTGGPINPLADHFALGGDAILANNQTTVRAALGLSPLRPNQTTFNFTSFPDDPNNTDILTRAIKPGPSLIGVDENRDGFITPTNGVDATSQGHPFLFWLNNNKDMWGGGDYQAAVSANPISGPGSLNSNDSVIGSPDTATGTGSPGGHLQEVAQRDLEDFAQVGLSWPASLDGRVTKFRLRLDSPSDPTMQIRLFVSARKAGLTGSAFSATSHVDDPSTINTILSRTDWAGKTVPGGVPSAALTAGSHVDWTPGSGFGLYVADGETNDKLLQVMFEGVQPGDGKLILELIGANNVVLASSAVDLRLQEMGKLYDHYSVSYGTYVDPTTKSMRDDLSPLDVNEPVPKAARLDGVNTQRSLYSNDYFLFVHGWRMQEWERVAFAESAYKRMFWSGYKGQFGMFDWPTQWVDKAVRDAGNYDRSEFVAWNSAAGLSHALHTIRANTSGHLSVMAHSMGNVVLSEALYLNAKAATPIVDSAIMSQAAISANFFSGDYEVPSIYASHAPDPQTLVDLVQLHINARTTLGPQGTNWVGYRGFRPYGQDLDVIGGPKARFRDIDHSAGKILNYYNPDDYALASWKLDQALKPMTDKNSVSDIIDVKSWLDLGSVSLSPDWSDIWAAINGRDKPGFGNGAPEMASSRYEYNPTEDKIYRVNMTYIPGSNNLSGLWVSPSRTALSFSVNKYEMFAFGASSVAAPMGTISPTSIPGVFSATGNQDLSALTGTAAFNALNTGHSAQFVHSFADVRPYWTKLVGDIQ